MRLDLESAVVSACQSSRSELAAELRLLNVRGLVVQGRDELDNVSFTPIVERMHPRRGKIAAGDATLFLTECLRVGEEHISRHADHYSHARWLWYFRHLPAEAYSIVGSGEAVRGRHLAETLAAKYGQADEVATDPFRVNSSTLKNVLRFLGMALHLDSIHGHLQWCGTDTEFEFTDRPIPDPRPTEEVKRAVEDWLDREAKEELDFSGLGSFLTVENVQPGEVGVLLAFQRPRPGVVDTARYLVNKRHSTVEAFFEPSRISLLPIVQMLCQEAVGEAPLIPGFYASVCVLSLGLVAFQASDGAAEQVLDHGFMMLDWESAGNLCTIGLPKVNSACAALPNTVERATTLDDLIRLVRDAGCSLRRLRPGPLMIAARGKVLLDIASATQRLFVDAEYPSVADARKRNRSLAFELATRKVIDESAWRAPEDIRSLCGRELRRDGRAITDVDAIGAKGSALLLVSCKSIPYSADVDNGLRARVRNVASDIADYEAEWRELVEGLRAQPVGDNFNFANYSEIHGVVITPHVFFVLGDQLNREVLPGLRAYSSASELKAWLNSGMA